MIYAVNKRTKEHRVVDFLHICGDREVMIQADPDGWIEHDRTGECPMPDDFRCDYRNARGRTQHDVLAGNVSWTYITSYRPILDTKPEAPEWDGEGLPPVGCECEAYFMHGATTRWRKAEVLKHGTRECAVFIPELNALGWCNTFRPIRSEEERVVEEMMEVDEVGFTTRDKAVVLDFARALYRAGYRKTAAADGEE